MLSNPEILTLFVIAVLGHVMAVFWFLADRRNSSLCSKTIYDLAIPKEQIRRELRNSIHTPIHAVLLGLALYLGSFNATTWLSFLITFLITAVWAEIWHYFSHRLMHLKSLLWIHREHHKSRLNSPFTAISFSFSEKLIFNIGIIGVLMILDHFVMLNFFGIAAWYVSYLSINSFSHANFELKSDTYLELFGKFVTSTTFHSLHHSRFINNYGLGTRFMDRIFKTEWDDYEGVYLRVTVDRSPLKKLKEKVEPCR
jgi:sterol desaturase/sphingolipid hydroxylase (fatty acid hydroxylase superfamily)